MHQPADIVKAQGLIAGGLSADTSKDLRLRLALDMLRVPYKYVTGYRSSPPARLALERGEISMFSESPPSYRSVVEPSLVKTGKVIPVFYDEVDDPPPPQKQLEGLAIPSFPQLYRQIKGELPSGKLWDAYKVLYDMNSTLQRMIVLAPGTPAVAVAALRSAIEALNNDKDFAAEAIKAIEFAPDYPAPPDVSQKVRAMMVTSPAMRDFINDYMRNPPKR
jgi:tripartite-type tricarboxylate transporter receptor subunit TctC